MITMESEPFLVTPEKGPNPGDALEGLAAFKRSLFEEPSTSKPLQTAEGSLPSQKSFSFASPPAKAPRTKTHLLEEDSRILEKHHPTNNEEASRKGSESIRPVSEEGKPEGTLFRTPLKAKRLDDVIFTPPAAARTSRPLSFASSPITPLHALSNRNSAKKSGRLKELSMQLKEAGQDLEGPHEASTSSLLEPAEASTSSPDCEPSAPHPYAMLASAQPAEELMADPKYRGMAALGCQHQYTDADRNKFLRRRKRIEAAGIAEIA